jgi:DNA-directed RNA polymerase subunit K/omega
MSNVPNSIITRDVANLVGATGNVYESIYLIGKRSRQIASKQKEEINNKLSEFTVGVDNLEEVHENREQIELSRNFERMPKPSIYAIEEFIEGKVFFRKRDEDEMAAAAIPEEPKPRY